MKSVLVIDDNCDYLELVNLVLKKTYNVTCIDSVDKLMNLPDDLSLDCIVMDYNIGPDSAVDALKFIKSSPNLATTPRILATGSVEIDEDLLKMDFSGFLEKPFKNSELKDLISSLVEA